MTILLGLNEFRDDISQLANCVWGFGLRDDERIDTGQSDTDPNTQQLDKKLTWSSREYLQSEAYSG